MFGDVDVCLVGLLEFCGFAFEHHWSQGFRHDQSEKEDGADDDETAPNRSNAIGPSCRISSRQRVGQGMVPCYLVSSVFDPW